jgi:SAM-dependent methyltransferase
MARVKPQRKLAYLPMIGKNGDGLDDPHVTIHRRQTILEKPFLKAFYQECYRAFLVHVSSLPSGKILEIGSGGGFLKELSPGIITSDILHLHHCDMQLSAERLPFRESSLSAIFMLNVLHHVSDCPCFFRDAERCLKPGGHLFMIEPASTVFSRLVYRWIHHERWEESSHWIFPSIGPLSDANIALPWIVFSRDRAKFEREYPSLQVVDISLVSPINYLVSGGFSFPSILPGATVGLINKIAARLTFFRPWVSLFQSILVRKQPQR